MYKRLTNEELNDFTSRVVVQLEPTLTQQVMSLILELTEYRTKIENGTLIELPCKVGDKIWYVSHIRIEKDRAMNILEEWEVEKIDIYDNVIICRLTHKGTDHYNTARNDEFGERWFLTKAEAEQKLKELQEK